MKKTTFYYNDAGQIHEKINSRRGFSVSSESYEYDQYRRTTKINYFNIDGNLEKTSTFLYNDQENRETHIITDPSKKLIRRIETRKNSNNNKIIDATFL